MTNAFYTSSGTAHFDGTLFFTPGTPSPLTDEGPEDPALALERALNHRATLSHNVHRRTTWK